VEALEVAMILHNCGRDVQRDPNTGLFVVDGTVPPTELTLPEYERGLRLLELREKIALGSVVR
jgi:hypothetical protein